LSLPIPGDAVKFAPNFDIFNFTVCLPKEAFPMPEWIYESATAMAAAIRKKDISAQELVRACLERIDAVNPRLNAVVQLCSEQALSQARDADQALARGETIGPLHGVPFTLKDAIETKGVICTGGTEGRAHYIPRQDAVVVERLRAAGAILLGKTNCPELGWAWEADNLIYGRTNNPYDLTLSPGGSSGGESATIAAGGSAFGLGSDAGGSVRFPAHCTGIASIKPTSGRVPRTGHFPGPGGLLDSIWQIGPLARYVEDLALVLPIISGVDWQDPAIVPMPLGDPRALDLSQLRVAFHTDNGIVTPSAEVSDAVDNAAKALAAAGIKVEEARPPSIEQTYEIYVGLFTADGGEGIESLLKQVGTTRIHPLMQRVLALQHQGAKSVEEFAELVGRWDAFRHDMLFFMSNYDALLCPVCSIAGMEHGSTYDQLSRFSYTMTSNLTGWPAAVVRGGMTEKGLPIGVQIVARPWREEVALALAQTLQHALGGFRPPAL
jgi:amidase